MGRQTGNGTKSRLLKLSTAAFSTSIYILVETVSKATSLRFNRFLVNRYYN